MDFNSINNCMSDRQKLSLSAAALQQMISGNLTYDDINNKMSDQQKLSLIAASLQKLSGEEGSSVISGQIDINFENGGASVSDYAAPLNAPNAITGNTIRQAYIYPLSGDVATFVKDDGSVLSWVDLVNQLESGATVNVSNVSALGGTYTEEDDAAIITPSATTTYTRLIGPSFAYTADGTQCSLSGFGFIGSDFAFANFFNYFAPYCIDLDVTRDASGKATAARAVSAWIAVIPGE